MKFISAKIFLYLIALLVNLLSFTNGISLTWVTPILPKLSSKEFMDENPFGRLLTAEELSWLASFLPLGAAVGALLSSPVADRIGRKGALLICGSLHVVSLGIAIFTDLLPLYYFSRILIGIAAGSGFTIIPMFLAEVSENHNRGILGCSMNLFLAVGINFPLLAGPFFNIQIYTFICLCFPLIFLALFSILSPETPVYLATIKDEKRLAYSLGKFRDKSPDAISAEASRLLEMAQEHSAKNWTSVVDFFKFSYLRKGLFISVVVIMLPQAIGIGPILTYLQIIFNGANVFLSPEICVAIVGAFQVLGAILSCLTIDRIGRRILLLISCIFVTLALIAFGFYFYLRNREFNVASITWLPLLSLVVYVIAFNVGVGSVCWVVMSELFPPNVSSIAASISSCSTFLLSFVFVRSFASVAEYLGIESCFFIFAIICFAGGVFIYFMLPETKGRSIQEIIKLLGYKEDCTIQI